MNLCLFKLKHYTKFLQVQWLPNYRNQSNVLSQAPFSISIEQRSPTFWAPGTGFVEDSFSLHGVGEGWFGR